jgi:hypothetical protein
MGYAADEVGLFIKEVESGRMLTKDFIHNFANTLREEVRATGSLAAGKKKLTSEQQRLTASYQKMVDLLFQKKGGSGGADLISGMFRDLNRVVVKLTPYITALGKVLFTTIGSIWDAGAAVVDLAFSVGQLFQKIQMLGQADKIFAGLRMVFHGLASAIYTVIAGIHELSALVRGDLDLNFDMSRLTDNSFWQRNAATATPSTTNNNNVNVTVNANGGDPDAIASSVKDIIYNELGGFQ